MTAARRLAAVVALVALVAVPAPAATMTTADATDGDVVAPRVKVVRLRHPGDRRRLRAVWTAADAGSGVSSSDVRWRRTDARGDFLPWRRPARWQRITVTRVTLERVVGGRTYCVAVRARDRAGNRSGWSTPRCAVTNGPVRTTGEGFRYAAGRSPVFGRRGTLHTYSAEVQRGTGFGPNQFTNLVDTYLGAARGWSRGSNVRLQRVPPRHARIRVVLARPATVERHCSWIANTGRYYSCWSGRYVMVNADRWHGGTDKFRGTLWQYRGYLLAHEVGHALGHRHRSCPARGRPAPVMMQQSKGTGACRPNPWPYP